MNMLKKRTIKNGIPPFSGKYRIITLRAKPKWIPVSLWLKAYHAGLLGAWVKNVSPVIQNKIVFNQDNGLNLVIQHLAGIDTYPLHIDSASIGTGSAAPSDSDTSLETPIVVGIPRATIDINLDNIVTEWFITNDELPNGTYTEFGLHCGTQFFARSLIDPSHSKASNEDTLVEYIISAANTLPAEPES